MILDWVYRLSLIFVMAAHGADLASTENCLGRGVCHELNRFYVMFQQPVVFGAAKMGVASVGGLAVHHVYEGDHKKWAAALNLAIGGTFTGIAIHNAIVAGQLGAK